MKIVIDGQEYEVDPRGDSVLVDRQPYSIRIHRHGDIVTVYVNERPFAVQLPAEATASHTQVIVDAKAYGIELRGTPTAPPTSRGRGMTTRPAPAAVAGAITAQMIGRVIRIDVQVGDEVREGDVILVIESMKMENEIVAPQAGIVKQVAVAPGARVKEGDLLVVLEAGS